MKLKYPELHFEAANWPDKTYHARAVVKDVEMKFTVQHNGYRWIVHYWEGKGLYSTFPSIPRPHSVNNTATELMQICSDWVKEARTSDALLDD